MADTHIKYNDHSIKLRSLRTTTLFPTINESMFGKDEQVEQLLADLLDAYNTDSQKAYFPWHYCNL